MKPDLIQLKKRTNLFVEDTFDRKGHVIHMQAQLARLMEENRILRKTETERMAADSQEMSAWRLIHVSPSPATPLLGSLWNYSHTPPSALSITQPRGPRLPCRLHTLCQLTGLRLVPGELRTRA